jgi:hypothetical protein
MSQFEIISELIGSLRKEEIRSLRRFLQLFEEGSETHQLKSLALLELILNTKNYPEETICKKLYGDSLPGSLKTFNKMLLRLKDKVYELLMLDINLFRKNGFGELNMAVSEIRKMLLQVNVIESRTTAAEVLRLYEKIRVIGRKYELYDELLQGLWGKLKISGQINAAAPKEDQMTEIMFFDRCRHSLIKARESYMKLVRREDSRLPGDTAAYDQAIEELEHEYRYTKSASVGYLLYDLMCHYQCAIRNYDAAEKACRHVISIVSENPAVYRDDRMTKAFLTLATIELFRFKFRQVEATIVRSQVYSKGDKALAWEAREISFLMHFYRGSLQKATGMLLNPNEAETELSGIQTAKNSFYLAAVNTVLGKTHEALQLLQNTAELEKGQPEWNAGVRLLVIFNLVQANKLDAAESHIENLRKYIERTSRYTPVTERISLILKMLARLVNESFDFNSLLLKEKNSFSLLESNVPGLAWQPKSAEVIILPLWIRSIATEKSYVSLLEEWFDSHKKVQSHLTLFD